MQLKTRTYIRGILILISFVGLILLVNAVWHLTAGVPPGVPFRILELALIAFLISPWSVKLPSGSSWRPGMPLMMLSIFMLPPEVAVIIPIPSLVLITFTARGAWWKYFETFAHVALGLYLSALVYRFLLGHLSVQVNLPVAVLAALLTHLIVNRLLSAIIVAYHANRKLSYQLKTIIHELHWGYVNSYLVVFLTMMNHNYVTLSIIVAAALQVGIMLAVSHYSKIQQLQHASWTDGLTNTENRNAWEQWIQGVRNELPTGSLFLVDFNDFKHINDAFGHLAGDNVLRQFTASVRRLLPKGSRLFRYGGDEFVGYVSARHKVDLQGLIDAAVEEVNHQKILTEKHVSVSVGIAHAPKDSTVLTELLRIADMRMYEEKRQEKLTLTGVEVGVPSTILGLVVALESRDVYTAGHTVRVAFYALKLAEKMGLSSQQKRSLYRSALVHDVGKIGIPDVILNKPDALTDEERELVERHPEVGFEMCSKLGLLQEELHVIRYHHEHWQGTGYPYQLKGEEIPLLARIAAVADVYDALTTNRAYRQAWSHDEAMTYIQDNKGVMFEPRCVDHWVLLNSLRPMLHQFPYAMKEGSLANIISGM